MSAFLVTWGLFFFYYHIHPQLIALILSWSWLFFHPPLSAFLVSSACLFFHLQFSYLLLSWACFFHPQLSPLIVGLVNIHLPLSASLVGLDYLFIHNWLLYKLGLLIFRPYLSTLVVVVVVFFIHN